MFFCVEKFRACASGKTYSIFCRASGLLLVIAMLVGCAGRQAFREGNHLLAEGKVDQGLAKLEEAVSLEPKNAEYRIALSTSRASAINKLNSSAEAARRQGRITDAERAYRQV